MAIYHFSVNVITRGTGRSVVAASAYASCSEIYNDYDGVNHNFTRKSGNIYSEIFLPPNAPTEWKDRAELWNAVEAAEKSKDNQLAREFIVALPVELGIDEWRDMLKKFVTENCVSKGMCADVNIHNTDGHNPHAHILLTVRPLDKNGKWQAKTQKEYICKRGNEERGFTADEFRAAQADGWEKQYQYFVGKKKIYMTPSEAKLQNLERVSKNPKSTRYGRQNPICAKWNSEEQIIQWRKAWENVTNKALEQTNIDARVDCRSFKERDIDEQPTIHEGVSARIMEKRGGISDRCELNRQIRKDNALLRELKATVKRLTALVENTAAKLAEKLENIRSGLITIFYQLKFNDKQLEQVEVEKQVTPSLIRQFRKVNAKITERKEERKKLQAEKSACSPLNIFKQNQLSKQIETVAKELQELKSNREFLLYELGCETEKDVDIVEQNFNHNLNVAKKLKDHNASLQEDSETEKSRYREIKDNIPPEDLPAVQEERRKIRNENILKTVQTLQRTYGRKYNYDLFRETEKYVSKELGEKPQSLRDKINRRQHEMRKTYTPRNRNIDEPKR